MEPFKFNEMQLMRGQGLYNLAMNALLSLHSVHNKQLDICRANMGRFSISVLIHFNTKMYFQKIC